MTSAALYSEDEEAVAIAGGRMPQWRIALAIVMFGGAQRRDFYDVFSIYLDRSIRQPQALAEIKAIEESGRSPLLGWTRPLSVAIPVWLYCIMERGESFGAVMADWLPHDEAMIFSALSASGLTGDGLRDLARLAARQSAWKRSLRRAFFPLFGAFALFNAGFYYLSKTLFPSLFSALPAGLELEGSAASLKSASDFFAAYGPLLLILSFAAPFVGMRLLPIWTGATRTFAEATLPLFGLYKKWTGLGFLLSLAALLKVGTSLRDALELLERRSPPYTRERLRAVIRRDDSYLGEALARTGFDWPDARTINLIRHFIVSDRPGDALAELAESSAQNLDATLTRFSSAIAYGVQLAVFGVILWFLDATNELSNLVQSSSH